MQISLRSYLTAGTAAVVGASALAMTPVTAASLNLPDVQVPSVAQVALAGFDSPISELLGTVILGSNYLFNETSSPFVAANWPFSGFTQVTLPGPTPLWPAALGTAALGGYSSVGLVPQIIDDALPVISQLGYNGSAYLQATLTGFAGAGLTLSEGIWNAAGDLLSFDIQGAIDELVSSVSNAGTLALAAGQFVLNNVITKASAVVDFLVNEIPTLIGVTVGQVSLLANALIKPITNAIAAFSDPNPIEGAWNALVDGYLGASGLPGTILNLTIGAGIQTGPITTPASIADNFVPSVRTVVQGAVKGLAGALAEEPAPPVASVRSAAAKAPAVTAADVKAEAATSTDTEAPSATTVATDNGSSATAGDSAPAPKPVKHRVSRKAASDN